MSSPELRDEEPAAGSAVESSGEVSAGPASGILLLVVLSLFLVIGALTTDHPAARKHAFQGDEATYYGIAQIPTAILIDQQGKVVTREARTDPLGVDQLGKHLEELLGKVEEPTSESEQAPEKRTAGQGSNPL